MDFKSKLRHVMDFPKEGVEFIDITPILKDPDSFACCINSMKDQLLQLKGFDTIAGPESRGFIFGAPLAYTMNKGFVPIRKKGKLPYTKVCAQCKSEYGADVMEIHQDAVIPGQNIVIVDDLLATGGTTEGNIELVHMLGGNVVGVICFIELEFLKGREHLQKYLDSTNIMSVVKL